MKQYLETYEIILKTRGPVFVGTGKEVGKKEYVFLSKEKVGIPDAASLYQLIKGKRKERDFEKFLLQGNNREDLSGWLRKNNIMNREIHSILKYELDCGDAVIEKNSRLQIFEAMKDPFGNPYIPGSTLKGMLRTILLSADLINNPKKYVSLKEDLTNQIFARTDRKINRNSFLKKEVSNIENRNYRTLERSDTKASDAVNDYMQGVVVSDSEPLTVNDLFLCQRIDVHTTGEEKKLPLLRECIKPGTMIKCSLTIDRSICNLTKEDILDAIAVFNNRYNKCFTKAFAGIDTVAENDVFLGGGTGFVSKTIVYAMYDKKDGIEITKSIFRKTNVPREHKHEKDGEYGASPHIYKCGRYSGKLSQMGLCSIHIEQI